VRVYASVAYAPRPTTVRTANVAGAEEGARVNDRADACSHRWLFGCDMARSCRVRTLRRDAAAAAASLWRCDGVVDCGRHAVNEAVVAVYLACCHIATHITSTETRSAANTSQHSYASPSPQPRTPNASKASTSNTLNS
jgi:hypothetical protein